MEYGTAVIIGPGSYAHFPAGEVMRRQAAGIAPPWPDQAVRTGRATPEVSKPSV